MAKLVTTSVSMLLLVIVFSVSSSEAHEDVKHGRNTATWFGDHVVGHSHGGPANLVRGEFGAQVKLPSGGRFGSHFGSKKGTPGWPDPIHYDAAVGIERQSPAAPNQISHFRDGIDSNLPKTINNKLSFDDIKAQVPWGPDHIHHK